MYALIAAAAIVSQLPPIIETYDRIRDDGRVLTNLGRCVNVTGGMRMTLVAGFFWKGETRPAMTGSQPVVIGVLASSSKPNFLKQRDMAILAGSHRVRPEPVDRDLDFNFAEGETTETLVFAMPFQDLQIVAAEPRIEMAVGPESFSLTSTQRERLTAFVKHLNTSPQELARLAAENAKAEEERRKAEEERKKAEAEARRKAVEEVVRQRPIGRDLPAEAALEKAKERRKAEALREAELQRLKPAKDAVDAAMRKAIKGSEEYSDPAVRTKIKRRTFDRELEAVIKKHKLQPKDVDSLLLDYPDFRARNKIQ